MTDTFADRLDEALTTRELVPLELAAMLGGRIAGRAVQRWRAGENAPGVEILPALCRALDVEAGWLVGATDRGGPQ